MEGDPGIPEVRVLTNGATVQDVSQEECLTRGWNYDRPWGSLLREKGNLRWEGLFF